MDNTRVKDIVAVTGGRLLSGDENTPIKNISIDSRIMRGNDLFVPLIGEKSDAHNYISGAIEKGAVCVLTSRDMEPLPGACFIKVDDTLKALQAIGREYRVRLGLPVVGITGSVGKTTTREMVATALSAKFKVYRTSKNFNSDIGLPVAVSEISADDEMAVLEMGVSDFGEMDILSSIAKPNMAVMTNIGVTHIEYFKKQENTFKEKFKITNNMKPDETLILNGDDPILGDRTKTEGFKRLYYGFGAENDFHAEDVVITENGTTFTAVCQGEKVPVVLPVMGNHMVMNALAAIAAASVWGIAAEDAAKELEKFKPFQRRQQIYAYGGFTIIDDTYNASPDSMKAALTVMSGMPCKGKRIAVLANMLELGETEKELHFGVGVFAKDHKPDVLVTIGELAKEIAKGLASAGVTVETHSFDTRVEAIPFVKELVKENDLVLFKGSNSMKLCEVIEGLKA